MKASLILSVAGLAAAAPQPRTGVPEYYLIRHAEKTGDGSLSAQGLQRAQCLVKVFGKDSKYNIQHIMVQTPHPGSKFRRLFYSKGSHELMKFQAPLRTTALSALTTPRFPSLSLSASRSTPLASTRTTSVLLTTP